MWKTKGVTTVTCLDWGMRESRWRRKEESIAVLSQLTSKPSPLRHWNTVAHREDDPTKQGLELSSVSCDNFSTRRLRHRHLPQTLFCSYPHSVFSISPSLFNHPEAFGHALRSSFRDLTHPQLRSHILALLHNNAQQKVWVPGHHFVIPHPLFFSTFLLIFN